MAPALIALGNETYKRLLIIWDYKFDVLTQLVMIGIIFIGASYFIGGGQFNPSLLGTLFIGYIVWFYARIVITHTSTDVIGEAQAGTLEQTYITPVPSEILILGRMIASLISTTLMVILTGLGLVLLLHIYFPLRWEGLPILALTIVGLFGFTLMLCGAALVFKQVESLADFTQNAFLFLTGALLPVSRFPVWLADIAKTLPITQGIVVLRSILLGGLSLSDVWANGSLLLLIINSAAYLCTGWLIFKWCERIAKRQGTLSQY